MRCRKLVLSLFLVTAVFAVRPAFAQDPNIHVYGSLIEGPAQPQDFTKWMAHMKRWRHEQLVRIGYDGSEYDRP